ncbi:MAG: hypothetical protein WAX77_05965 [Methylococcaceae bacterium]
MSYSDFNLKQVKELFQLTIIDEKDLFSQVSQKPISQYLNDTLNYNVPLAMAIGTEKAKSELIISNVLLEVRKILNNKVSFFSGVILDVDKEKGLSGFCDFILSKSEEQLYMTAPIITIVEAKNDYIMGGLGQCIAEMVAASLFNKGEGSELPAIYGVVTTGNIWKFLTLENNTVHVDFNEYHISQIEKIVSILVNMIER